MTVLALELSTGHGSIAWITDGEGPSVRTFANDRKHSGLFFENVQSCLREIGQPNQIVVGLGPGSYAGVRIAIATAVGLRAASGSKLIGLPSICAMEVSVSDYSVIGDARRASFFFARLIDRRLVDGPSLFSVRDLELKISDVTEPVLISELVPEFPNTLLAYPSAVQLALLAKNRVSEMVETEVLEPIYLREPHVTVPKAKKIPMNL